MFTRSPPAMRPLWLALAAALIALPGALRAQDEAARRDELARAKEELRAASKRVAELSREIARAEAATAGERGRLGIVLGKRGPDQLEISAVTPGGAAEKAGVRAGDRLVAVDGRTVVVEAGRDLANLAGLAGLKRGQQVVLTVERDGKRQAIPVTAEARGPVVLAFGPGFDGAELEGLVELADLPERMARVQVEVARAMEQAGIHRDIQIVHTGPEGRRGLHLIDLDPELGRYFSTSTGVLVASRQGPSFQGLKAGDVLLEIAGEPVANAREAWRRLHAQPAGQRFAVDVMRDQRRQRIELTGSEAKPGVPLPPRPPVPPLPPEAPLPPEVPPVPPPGGTI